MIRFNTYQVSSEAKQLFLSSMQGIKRLRLRDPEPMPVKIQSSAANKINYQKYLQMQKIMCFFFKKKTYFMLHTSNGNIV